MPTNNALLNKALALLLPVETGSSENPREAAYEARKLIAEAIYTGILTQAAKKAVPSPRTDKMVYRFRFNNGAQAFFNDTNKAQALAPHMEPGEVLETYILAEVEVFR